jgi:hypothetical protein
MAQKKTKNAPFSPIFFQKKWCRAHAPRTINLAAAHSKPLHALSRAFSRLSMPKNGEISVQNTENSVQNTENGAENTENGVQNTENGVQNAVFRAKSAENGAQNAEKAALFDDDDAAADMAERLLGHGRWARFFGVFRLKNTVFRAQNADFRAQNTVFRAQNTDFRSKNGDFGAGSGVLSPESGESGSKTGVFIAQTEAAVINFDIEDSDYQRRLAVIAVAPIGEFCCFFGLFEGFGAFLGAFLVFFGAFLAFWCFFFFF